MKAIVFSKYGPPEVLEVREVAEPRPREGDLLIRVRATTVTSGDARVRAMRMPSPVFALVGRLALGVFGPRNGVLGTELAGVVKAVGKGVTSFRIGDSVVAVVGARFGAHAEYVCVREASPVVKKPAGLSHEEAVAIPFGAITALYYLRNLAGVAPGQRVLVVGASGAVGTAAVQLARYFGAEVTGVCSAANAELVRSLGAGRVIDYTMEDFSRGAAEYDVVFDTVGVTSFARCRNVLKPNGQFLAAVITPTEIRQLLWTRLVGGRRVRGGVVPETTADLGLLMGLAEAGHLRPVIERRYPMHEIVAAHRHVDSGRKVGSVVVTMGEE
jgi:NADPH:quinone reductase-like Zn-dependent oxidoreductase